MVATGPKAITRSSDLAGPAPRRIDPVTPRSLSPDQIAAERGPFAGTAGHLDAPYLATPPKVVERMLDLAQVGAGTRLVDLGCGDGRIVIAAARK